MRSESRQAVLPPALKPGDTIGIAAPAGDFDRRCFAGGVRVLEGLGFKVLIPDEIFKKKRYLAGSDENRAEVLNRLFQDPVVKAVLCARGGFGSLRILHLLDFASFGRTPKIFAGFSDITILLSVIFQTTGLVTFHAPVITSLADAGQTTAKSMRKVFTSAAVVSYRTRGAAVVSGVGRGVLRGGNLSSLCHLTGTPYQPDYDGALLFLEDINEPAYRIDRMLAQMRLAGCLGQVAGVLLGRFGKCGSRRVVYDIVREHFPLGTPILAGFSAGHGGENLTLPLGLPATLDADAGVLRFHGPAVADCRG